MMSNPRGTILALLRGEHPPSVPPFSGLVHVTAAGLESEGLALAEAHRDADKMARAAASTFRLTGFPSAALPFDLCVEAEILGASVDFPQGSSLQFPRPGKPPFDALAVLLEALQSGQRHPELLGQTRLPLVCLALSQLKAGIGNAAVIGAVLAGPFTVLAMLLEQEALFRIMKGQSEAILQSLISISSFLSQIGRAYRDAGADFLTIHEMGGSPDILGAKRFEDFVLPALKGLIQGLPRPHVLAVCGRLLPVSHLLPTAGADALSIDQSNDLGRLRKVLPGALLFGNLDPVQILSLGTPSQIRAAAQKAWQDGADAVWPGCDLVPATPTENIRALAQ